MDQSTLQSIFQYRELSENLATAGQPDEAQLEALAGAGFEAVINLALHDDPRYSLPDEAGTVAALGMRYFHIPVAFAAPSAADLATFFNVMAQVDGRKLLIHCAQNKRVPVFIALYRILKQAWSQTDAFAAMQAVWQPDPVWERFIQDSLPD